MPEDLKITKLVWISYGSQTASKMINMIQFHQAIRTLERMLLQLVKGERNNCSDPTTHTHTHIHTPAHTHPQTHRHTCTHAQTRTHTDSHTDTHTHMHTCTDTHTHTQTCNFYKTE